MKKSYQECLQQIKSEYKDLYPIWYIEHGGKYIFNMLKRGVDREDAISNFYIVDASTGESAGPIPVMSLYDDDSIASKLHSPHKIGPEDQKLEHGVLKNGNTCRYRIRRTCSDDIEYGGYLSHHGIQGQKWGHRNGPPYPLKPEMHSKAEKDAAKSGKRAKATEKDSSVKAVVAGSAGSKSGGLVGKIQENKAKAGDQFLAGMDVDSSNLINREETKKDKIDKTSAALDAVSVILNPVNLLNVGVKAGLSANANHKLNKYFREREANGKKDPKTGLYLKNDSEEGEKADKADLAAVNPGVNNLSTNTKNNCMLCTTTYDLRKRGFDVTAQLDSQGYNFKDLQRWYPKAKVEKNNRYGDDGKALSQKEYVQKTIKNLLKQGDGARGNMMVQFNEGGGHSIIYEIKNGQVVFKDGQINQVYKNPEKFLNGTLVNAFARLDNVEPNMEEIKKSCVR